LERSQKGDKLEGTMDLKDRQGYVIQSEKKKNGEEGKKGKKTKN